MRRSAQKAIFALIQKVVGAVDDPALNAVGKPTLNGDEFDRKFDVVGDLHGEDLKSGIVSVTLADTDLTAIEGDAPVAQRGQVVRYTGETTINVKVAGDSEEEVEAVIYHCGRAAGRFEIDQAEVRLDGVERVEGSTSEGTPYTSQLNLLVRFKQTAGGALL